MNHCFGFSSEPGCVQEESPECRTSPDQFEKRRGGFVGTASSSRCYRNDSSSIGLSDCWDQCWNDCSCVGFDTYYKNNGSGCVFWREGAQFEQSYDGSGMEYYVLNSSFPISKDNSDSGGNLYNCSFSSFLSLFLICIKLQKLNNQ
ncbi:PAN/Apple domain containing protein [Parasponia andersonii]|uniref:PAN/Apple domain containing protein n=1 Tax=Parasponia andersonii TaxID=3476 RepID=A0A2P5AHJ9_PARAD|nr:PAN/Apple domain containing protein [Parasponia andersonii]